MKWGHVGDIMKDKSSKGDLPKRSKSEPVTDEAILGQLADCVLYNLKKEMQNESEPFHLYESRLKVRFHRNANVFRERLAQGYEALLEALSEKTT